jgi:phosphoglycerate dehydrogenase-like enzyme
MGNSIRVLFLPHPHIKEPWESDLVKAVGARHKLLFCDYHLPIKDQFKDASVVIDFGGSMGTREMADAAALHSVKLWQLLGTGFDHFDLGYWRSKKIPVANCPGEFSAVALGECAMMYILMLARRWHGTQDSLRRGVLCVPGGLEVEGRRLGLVGFGASARQLAKRARAFDMRISAIDVREIPAEEQKEFGLEFVGKPDDLDRLMTESDYVSLHLHLNAETRHIINGPRLRLMKPDACLINVARGALVDEGELYRALFEGRIGGAGLDVFSQEPPDPNIPLLKLPNVIATPHIAGVTDGTSRRRAQCAAQNVERVAAGLEPLYRID